LRVSFCLNLKEAHMKATKTTTASVKAIPALPKIPSRKFYKH
jgi:hypothetical protein